MRCLLRHMFGLLCAVVIVLNGTMVAALAMQAPVSEIIICGSHGEEAIRLDIAGNPTDQTPCCDCAKCLSLVGGLPERAAAPARSMVVAAVDTPRHEAVLLGPMSHFRPLPRGPPLAQPDRIAPLWHLPQAGSALASLALPQPIRGQNAQVKGQPTEVAP